METVATILSGSGVAIGYQLLKGDWNRWLNVIVALAAAFSAGYAQGGVEAGLMAAVSALAAHSAFLQGQPLGKAMQLHLAPRLLRVVSELALAIADAFEKKPE